MHYQPVNECYRDFTSTMNLQRAIALRMDARRDAPNTKLKPGQKVMLKGLPKGFTDDLPLEDKQAISDVVGNPILLKNYEDDGRAELEFTDGQGVIHLIYLDPKFLDAVGQ